MNKVKRRNKSKIAEEKKYKQPTNIFNFEIDYDKLADAIVKAELRVKEREINKDYEDKLEKKRLIDYIILLIGLCFYPKHMKNPTKNIHYNLLLTIVSLIFDIIGYGLSIIAFLIIAGALLNIIDKGFSTQIIFYFMCSFITLLFGGAFRLAEKQLDQTKNDMESILSYISAFFGFLSFIVAIIAVIISINY